ncbi:MAG: pseudouridine synthase [Candidatus Saccharimonadales bacterium]
MNSDDTPSQPTRLNKYLALQLGISRREADEYIERQDVVVNNTPAILGSHVTPKDTISVRGEEVRHTAKKIYLAFNKPVGYVCSRKQQGDAPTIYSIIPKQYHALKPVGRLDKDSSGLLLLSNDGDFAFHMTHPQFYKKKIYGVHLDRNLEPLHQQMISDRGITLDDGLSKFELEKVVDDRRDMWRITMSEGRNRQIRRTFTALGYTVTALHRTQFGIYTLGDLAPGEWQKTQKL